MKSEKFLNDNFYLNNDLAVELYHSSAKNLPVVDYHNHLNPEDLFLNRKFNNIADAWLLTDPYKHRAMRISGIPESSITGNDSDKNKFLKWAETLPKTLGNPLFIWSALELKRIFGIEEFLTDKNAAEIWENCSWQLKRPGFGATDILKKFSVEILCTSDDILDDVNIHKQATRNHEIGILPSLRGDSILNIDQPVYSEWFDRLRNQSNQNISSLEGYKSVITELLDKFSEANCHLADHSLDAGFMFYPPSESKAIIIFEKWMDKKELELNEVFLFKNYMLHFLGVEYARRGWVLQLHIGAQRFTSSRLRNLAGPAGGYGTIGNSCDISGLCSFLDELEKKESLPRIILYTLNPSDNETFATLTGSYSENGVPGKIQFGPGWWYNDQYEGIRCQITNLASYGLLSQFIGMTTDSRSVFSFSRHEFFRRILCNLIAEWVENGNLPNDYGLLSNLVTDISFSNCKNLIFKK